MMFLLHGNMCLTGTVLGESTKFNNSFELLADLGKGVPNYLKLRMPMMRFIRLLIFSYNFKHNDDHENVLHNTVHFIEHKNILHDKVEKVKHIIHEDFVMSLF